ncbi:hypothetical protein PHYPSEUDO_012502 [Phytophthora pseudosyringae]|uniref:EF-hand domain-containing protein n=1 Tax=Phytophthora pseudosyringae TaxID=221518 RepID=A0A8T1W538_9STRA|nr:hypothetical protein PHYPSEUDO_012502 [Phytophthora pseudosyringae]
MVLATKGATGPETNLRLSDPFNPAKKLVSTALSPSVELTKRLETSPAQTFVREMIREIVTDVVSTKPKEEKASTLVTSFEPMTTLPIVSSNLRVGPSMRYLATWSANPGPSGDRNNSTGVSVLTDQLTDRKLLAYWEGLLLQAGTFNKKVRLGDVKHVVHRNAHLALLQSSASQEMEDDNVFTTKSDNFQLTYEAFCALFRLPPSQTRDETENDTRLQVPLAYLRTHFQELLQSTTFLTNGFKAVSAAELLRRVFEDVRDYPPVVSDDPKESQEADLELTQSVCQHLERSFVGSERTGQISWPELAYFVRYKKLLTTPEIFPATGPQLVLGTAEPSCSQVAEVVSGMHSSRLLVVYFDGCVEVWGLSSCSAAVREAKGLVLFSRKQIVAKGKGRQADQETPSGSFVRAWMDATQSGLAAQDQQVASRIHQFKGSTGTDGALVRFCAWDSVLCVNSSILQESGSGSFRFFRLADNFVSPIRQVTVEHVKVELSSIADKGSSSKIGRTQQGDSASSSGVVRSFEVTADGSKIVFLTASETILWVACAGTGEILCHANLQMTQLGKFRALFHIAETHLPSGEIETQLYATTSANLNRHAGMWILPPGSQTLKPFDRNRVFSFGKAKTMTVVHLVVSAELLFVASRDGSVLVWSTASDRSSPALPLACLEIPLRSEELQSICCHSLQGEGSELRTSTIQVGDRAAAGVDRWERKVLQRFTPPPLRFALYLFDDGQVIRLAVLDKFDMRLATLDDPAFEFDALLAPASGPEQNEARRVTLQKHRITRVLFLALRHSRDESLAQKSVHEFFAELEKRGVLWKTRDEMVKFALSFHEKAAVQLQTFYRRGDSEHVELTQPQRLSPGNACEGAQIIAPVLAVGAILKSRIGEQTQFQAWKLAMNWSADTELDPGPCELDDARRGLVALQSSYRLETDRVRRIQRDISRDKLRILLKDRRTELIQGMKDDIRDVIAQSGPPIETHERLLKTMNAFMLASFHAQLGRVSVEAFVLRVFNQAAFGGDSSSLSHVEASSFLELIRRDGASSLCFGAWVERLVKAVASTGEKGVTWDWLSVLVRHIEACCLTTAELGFLFVDLGLASAYTCPNGSTLDAELGLQMSSSLPSLVQQLHRFLASTGADTIESSTLDSTMDVLHSPQAVVEFIVECTNLSSFFRTKIADLWTRVTELVDAKNEPSILEESYAIQRKVRQWQRELGRLAQSQNELASTISGDDVLEPTVEDLQTLQRFLKTPLPCVSPKVSSITLENRCETIRCRSRFVMNARGRLEGAGEEFVPLSVLYVVKESGKETKLRFQQELSFLRKVQRLRAREFFLPACLDVTNISILPAANGSMVCGGGTDEVPCIVAESLRGWSSITEWLKFMHSCSSAFALDYWKPLLWRWGIRVLMALLTMENERFALREGIDMDMILVSPDGKDLRLCSLSGGSFDRFGEKDEDAHSRSQASAKVFGCFVDELLHGVVCVEDNGKNCEFDVDVSKSDQADVDDDKLCKRRNQLLRLLSSKGNNDNKSGDLTDCSTVSQIATCAVGTHEGDELDRLRELALLGLQRASTRPGITSLWVYAGRPGMKALSEETAQFQTVSRHLMTLVGFHRSLEKMLQDLRVCSEYCDDGSCGADTLQLVIASWIALLERLFQLKTSEDATTHRIFETTLRQILDNFVPNQLCEVTLRVFTQCSKRGDRDQGRDGIETLLRSFANVLELVETNTNFDELQRDSLLMRTVQQVLDCLLTVASSHEMPPTRHSEDKPSTTSHIHRDATTNAMLWRLSEPLFRNLLAIETASSKFAALLRWLESRRPPFGVHPTFVVCHERANQELSLWWDDLSPEIPHHIRSSAAEDELVQNGYTREEPTTAKYLRCVYETKEIEFKLTSGVGVPKFRLAALQQFFGPSFFERTLCFPSVSVRPLVAAVWHNLGFERLICTLLRDGDEKLVLGALSLLECGTRVFRLDPLRSPRTGRSTNGASAASNSQDAYTFSCPERTFAMNLCSQSVVSEVKRLLHNTTRALKVLGESGTSSASRSQHPLVAILCVGLAWFVNCLHGGDGATQFWGMAGIDQLIVAHWKTNSLPFVKVRDSNMMNEVFHKSRRLVQQDPATANSKWRVFTWGQTEAGSYQSVSRNCSPFRLMLEEIVCVGSTRAIGLMRTLLLARIFREEAAGTDECAVVCGHDSAFQRDLISNSEYGKVSHAIDLARDITELNGTINEQVQVILYANALFLYHAASSGKVSVNAFASVCKEIWAWVEVAWRNVVLHSSSNATGTGGKGVKLSRAQGDVVISAFSLLHSIVSHPAVLVEDIVALTTFDAGESAVPVNVLHELVCWVTSLPNGVARRLGSTVSVLIERSVTLLTNAVQARRYDDVSLATMDTCVDVRVLLELLAISETSDRSAVVSIDEKHQLWAMLLYFDSHTVTSRILDVDFLDAAVFQRLLGLEVNTPRSRDTQSASLNQRLEAAMFLDVLVSAASRREKSANSRMLLAEACKLLLRHEIIAKEAAYVRKTRDSTTCISRKLVAVCKRVMQLACFLCVDNSSQSASRVFLDQLEAAGVPAWVVSFHQAKRTQTNHDDDKLLPRAKLFWQNWQGHPGAVGTKCAILTKGFELTDKSESEKAAVQTAPHRIWKKKPSFSLETMASSDDAAEVKRTTLSSEEERPHPRKARGKANAKRKPRSRTRGSGGSSSDDSASASERDCSRRRAKAAAARQALLRRREPAAPPPSQQHEALRAIFRKYDVDGDGAISFVDLRRAMDKQVPSGQGHRLSDVQIQRWITEKDTSGQGVVSLEDFATAFQGHVGTKQ